MCSYIERRKTFVLITPKNSASFQLGQAHAYIQAVKILYVYKLLFYSCNLSCQLVSWYSFSHICSVHPLIEWVGVVGGQHSVDLKFHILSCTQKGGPAFLSLKKQSAKNSGLTLDNGQEKQEKLTSTSKKTEQKWDEKRNGTQGKTSRINGKIINSNYDVLVI